MMLIDKEAAYTALKREAEAHMLPESHEAYTRAARIIDQMKPVDVESVKRGKWIEEKQMFGIAYRCSVCGKFCQRFSDRYDLPPYCMHCGARMEDDEKCG